MSFTKKQRRRQTVFRWVVLTSVLGFLMIPLLSMLIFTFRQPLSKTEPWTVKTWATVFGTGESNDRMERIWEGLNNSLLMGVLTVFLMLALLLPTMLIARLYSPKLLKVVEFFTTLPLALPAIALVVGLGPVFRFMAAEMGMEDSYWLGLAYVIFVLPYSFRAIDAGMKQMDVRTLYEAARSLGESWMGTLMRVIVPNLRSAILSACFISVTVVLGEYTIAALLLRQNLQTSLYLIGQSDPSISSAMSLLALLFAMLVLVIIDILSGRKKGAKRG
ncbi:MAG: ABC transporter permease subunit [Microbacteriaceae bacterium]|nr:ABC transporter permease subunit [Microbacteriaceae bacterium]